MSDEQGQFGSFLDVAEFKASPQAIPPQWVTGGNWPTTLPVRATLTDTPSIAMQGSPQHLGSPGSCEAQSFGYGLGTYTADQANGNDPTNAQYQVSAAWLYAWALSGQGHTCPKGSLATPYLRQLITAGCPSASQVPYTPDCTYIQSINLTPGHYGTQSFFLGSYATFQINNDTMPLIKAFLAAGQAVAFSGLVLNGYSNPTLTPSTGGCCSPGVITETQTIPNSGHGQLLIGYDDGCTTESTQGAFLIQNSFGTDWPPAAPGGTVWWSYNSFLASQKLAAVAYPTTPPASSNSIGLSANPPSSPSASLQLVTHWAPGGTDVYLILLLQFDSPVTVSTVSIQQHDSKGTGRLVTGSYDNPIACGYLYFARTDGAQYEHGTYALNVEATSGSTPITYSCEFEVSDSAPTTPAPQPIEESTVILDTVGKPATINS